MKRRNFFKLLVGALIAPFLPNVAESWSDATTAQLPDEKAIADYTDRMIREAIAQMRESMGMGALDIVRAAKGNHLFVDPRYFYSGQRIRIFSADCKVMRGSRLVKRVEDTHIVLDSRVPGDTVSGDLIVLGDDTRTFIADSSTGGLKGLARS